MSASNAFETALLNLVFANVALSAMSIPASTIPGQLYLSLHTADPGEAGTQSTNETVYAGYTRIPIIRGVGGWTVAGATATNAVAVDFPGCTSGSHNITHFGIGTVVSGASFLLFSGTLTTPLTVTANIIPSFGIGSLVVTID